MNIWGSEGTVREIVTGAVEAHKSRPWQLSAYLWCSWLWSQYVYPGLFHHGITYYPRWLAEDYSAWKHADLGSRLERELRGGCSPGTITPGCCCPEPCLKNRVSRGRK